MTATDTLSRPEVLTPFRQRQTRIGLVAGGLAASWHQFPDLLLQLRQSTAYVVERLDAEVVDVGPVFDAQESAIAAERLRRADGDLVVVFLSTYLTSSMVLPIAQRSPTPVLVIDLQPTEAMDHASFSTGEWIAHCGQCPVPEVANVVRRAGIPFRSVSGHLRHARHGPMGDLSLFMLDVSTDPTVASAQVGSHVDVLEPDDLLVGVAGVRDAEVAERKEPARSFFVIDDSLDDSLDDDDFTWAARVSCGLDHLMSDVDLDSVTFYHRGLDGEQHERRVSVEFDVKPGPVTACGVGRDPDGALVLVTAEGTVVPGPLRAIGTTTSRVSFGGDPGEWVDTWSQPGIGHHWALCVGHRADDIAAAASLLGVQHRHVSMT